MIRVFLTEILENEKKEGRKEENKQYLQDTLGKIWQATPGTAWLLKPASIFFFLPPY